MLEKIVIISLVVWAIHSVFWSGMILGFVSRWLSYRIPTWLQKIIYGCSICQVPYYGSALYWIVWHNSIMEYILCVLGALGLNAIIVTLTPEPELLEEEDADPSDN